jgi:pseudouridine synthase
MTIRLSKLLSQHAKNFSMSRRQAEKLIQEGHVTIAGQVIRQPSLPIEVSDLFLSSPSSSSSSSSLIKVQGKALQLDSLDGIFATTSSTLTTTSNALRTPPQVWAVHKLAGEVVTENDPQGRPSLMDRLKRSGVGRRSNKNGKQQQQQQHIKPIGRLDMPTEGLILVTNDGQFARDMELPQSALHRVYRARVHGRLTSSKLDRIRRGGILVDNNIRYGPMKVAVERPRKGTATSTNTWLQVTCTEGKNRQVRNVFAALGSKSSRMEIDLIHLMNAVFVGILVFDLTTCSLHFLLVTVTRLIRISYGDYRLDTIPKGMAIPVPYKPVERQKAKGAFNKPTLPRSKHARNNNKKLDQASPVKWVTSRQVRTMSTTTKFSSTSSSTHDNDMNVNDGQLASQKALQENVLSLFPHENLVYCFGYGSGVFSQTIDVNKKHEGMLDLIMVVDDAERFHQTNLQVFPHHYAPWLRWGGPSLVTNVQRHFPLKDAHVLFHVVDDPVPMKYGVVQQQDLLRDLTQWETLYLAGRLHKPTLPLVYPPLPDWFVQAQHQNLQSATAAALLLMMMSGSGKNDRSWETFFRTIASLSYTGDFRMQVGGEDPQKLDKLVRAPGQLGRFQDMYRPSLQLLERDGTISIDPQHGIEWNVNDSATIKHFQSFLPESIQSRLPSISNVDGQIMAAAALSRVLAATVAPAARHQSFKGIATLGFRKSLQYASAKLSKGLLSSHKA